MESIPRDMYVAENVGIYPYFPVGAGMHFCVIPVNEDIASSFEKSGVNIIKNEE